MANTPAEARKLLEATASKRGAALVHWSAALAGMFVRPGEYLRAFIERHYRLETLRVQVAELEMKMSREKQLDKKYELAKERQLRDKELLLCL